MPISPTPGRSLVSRRAVVEIVRTATLGSYGVTGLGGGWLGRLAARLGLDQPGITVGLDHGLTVDLDLTIAYGLPVAEVARQVDSAVRYAVRRSLDREIDRLTIHVDGLRYQPGGLPPAAEDAAHSEEPAQPGLDDLAASGTDVA